MQQIKSLKAITVIFVFSLAALGLFASGCATGKNLSKIDTGISATAAGTSEGILLQITNISENINGLNVILWNITEVDYLEKRVYIKGAELAELRKTGELLCPFVKNGQEYSIQIYTHNKTEPFRAKLISVKAVALGGIYPLNNPQLSFDDEYKSITLSAKPIFSDEVVYAKEGLFLNYFLSVHNENGEYMHSGGEEWLKEFAFDFPWKSNGTKTYFRIPGNIMIDATVRCVLKYGDMEWDVGIVRTTNENISSS